MLTEAHQSDYKGIVSLLRDVRFPNLPDDGSAECVLDTARNFILRKDGEIIGWVGIHSFWNKSCYLDIAIKKNYRGKWLTKGLLKDLGKCIFSDMGMDTLYVECFVSEGVKLAYRLGFQNTLTDPHGGVGMVLTKEVYESKF